MMNIIRKLKSLIFGISPSDVSYRLSDNFMQGFMTGYHEELPLSHNDEENLIDYNEERSMTKIESLEAARVQYKELELYLDEIQAEVDARFVELPVDADGRIIHINDCVKNTYCSKLGKVISITYGEDMGHKWTSVTVNYGNGKDNFSPEYLRHHWETTETTTEDVLREFLVACDESGWKDPLTSDVVKKFAKKLKLADNYTGKRTFGECEE